MPADDRRTLEWDGKWRLAEGGDWISGILRSRSHSAFELDLQGSLPGDLRKVFSDGNTVVLHGIVRNGDFLSAEAFSESTLRASAFGIQKTYGVQRVIKGGHFPSLDPEILCLEFRLTHIEDWVRSPAFSFEEKFENYPHGRSYQIAYKEPDSTTLAKVEDVDIKIIYWGTSGSPRPHDREISLSHFCGIRIDSISPKRFSELARLAGQTQALVSLATSHRNSFVYFAGYQSMDTEAPLRKRPFNRIDFFPLGKPAEKETEEILFPHEMLFNLEDALSSNPLILQEWYRLWPRLKSIVQLYLGAMQNSEIYEEHRFLSLVQALEGFHRLYGTRNLLSPRDHKARVEEILANAPAGQREFLRASLQHSNEPSLRMRLDEQLQQVARTLPDLATDSKSFISRVVNTRHFLSHSEPGLAKRAARGWDLYEDSIKLSIMMELLILEKLGFSPGCLKQLVERSQGRRARRRLIPFLLEAE